MWLTGIRTALQKLTALTSTESSDDEDDAVDDDDDDDLCDSCGNWNEHATTTVTVLCTNSIYENYLFIETGLLYNLQTSYITAAKQFK